MGSRNKNKSKKKKRNASSGEAAAPVEAKKVQIPEYVDEAGPIKWTWLAGMFVVAFIVRVISLGRADLWGDEVLFVQSAMPPMSPLDVFSYHVDRFLAQGQFPLPAMVHNAWLWMVQGFSEDLIKNPFLQRFTATLWGAGTIPLYFLLINRLLGRNLAWICAVIMTFFYFPVHYSREAYVYAPLLFLGTGVLLVLVSMIQDGIVNKKRSWLFFLGLTGACLCHMTGSLMAITILALATFALAKGSFPGNNSEVYRRVGLRIWLLCLAALLCVVPFFKQQIGAPPHVWPAGHPPISNLYDFFGKVFLGSSFPAVILTILLVVGGCITLASKGPRRYERMAFMLFGVVGFALIFFSTVKTQYTPRYFYLVTGFLYAVFALGIDGMAGFLSDKLKKSRVRIAQGITGAMILLHIILYLPNGYALTSKALDYGTLADWLNDNLRPGTSYVLESAYDQRFLPGYFPTPDLVAATPYVHGAGAEEMERMRQLQQQYMLQFPESAFVEASRHGTEPGAPYDVWTFPHQFYQNVAWITNHPLKKLVKLGMYPPFRDSPDLEKEYIVPIWYNRAEDLEGIWSRNGRKVLVTYPPPWRVQPVQQAGRQTLYSYIAQGGRASVTVKNLTGESMRGSFQIRGALMGADRGFKLDFRLNGTPIGQAERWTRQFWALELPAVDLPPGEHTLEWGVPASDAFALQGLAMLTTDFVPEGRTANVPDLEKAEAYDPNPKSTEQNNSGGIQWTPPGS